MNKILLPAILMALCLNLTSVETIAAQYPGNESRTVVSAPRTITLPETTETDTENSTSTTGASRSFGTTIAALGAILLLFLGLVQIWRRFAPTASQSLPTEAWEILGSASLDHKFQLQIVRVGSRLIVLGKSDQGLQTLSEITESDEVSHLLSLCRASQADSSQPSFSDLIHKFRSHPDTEPRDSSPQEAKHA